MYNGNLRVIAIVLVQMASAASSLIPERCGPRCQEWLPSPEATRCPQHQYLDDDATRHLAGWLAEHDPGQTFTNWMRTRTESETHTNVQSRFQKRQDGVSDRGAQRWDSRMENIAPLFNRFLRYALDVDLGLGFVDHAVAVARRQGSCRFLDIGFAPGGMSQLLLDADPTISGVGITLAPESGGNAYLESLRRHSRYSIVETDAIDLALGGLPDQYSASFDIVICGITISGSQNDDSCHGQLKDRLHLAQMLLAFRCVRPGGGILTRMHLSVRPLEWQMLALLLDNSTASAAYKPLTEFAMRKTFWMVFGKIRPKHVESLTGQLRSALEGPSDLEHVNLAGISVDDVMDKFGRQIVTTLGPIWRTQTEVLKWVMAGGQDRLCGRCRRTSPRFCSSCQANVYGGVRKGVEAVQRRLRLSATRMLSENR